MGERIEGETQGVAFVIRLAVRLTEAERGEVERLVTDAFDRVLPGASAMRLDSDASRLNRAEAEVATPVSMDTLTILQEAARVSELTGGALDVTAGPLARLWGIGSGLVPSATAPLISPCVIESPIASTVTAALAAGGGGGLLQAARHAASAMRTTRPTWA